MWIIVIIYLCLSCFGLNFMKQGMDNSNFELVRDNSAFFMLNSNIDLRAIIGASFYVLSFLTWLFLLKKYDLSYIFPIVTGLAYIGVMLISYFVLAEKFDIFKILGAVMILAGVVLVNIKVNA